MKLGHQSVVSPQEQIVVIEFEQYCRRGVVVVTLAAQLKLGELCCEIAERSSTHRGVCETA